MSIDNGQVADADDFKNCVSNTAAATKSITTTATSRVIVWAKGTLDDSSGTGPTATISLKYNGVTKDTVIARCQGASNFRAPFALMYTEVPGAGTHDITVTTDAGTLSEVDIMVIIF